MLSRAAASPRRNVVERFALPAPVADVSPEFQGPAAGPERVTVPAEPPVQADEVIQCLGLAAAIANVLPDPQRFLAVFQRLWITSEPQVYTGQGIERRRLGVRIVDGPQCGERILRVCDGLGITAPVGLDDGEMLEHVGARKDLRMTAGHGQPGVMNGDVIQVVAPEIKEVVQRVGDFPGELVEVGLLGLPNGGDQAGALGLEPGHRLGVGDRGRRGRGGQLAQRPAMGMEHLRPGP
jgi:hypothetical protein